MTHLRKRAGFLKSLPIDLLFRVLSAVSNSVDLSGKAEVTDNPHPALNGFEQVPCNLQHGGAEIAGNTIVCLCTLQAIGEKALIKSLSTG